MASGVAPICAREGGSGGLVQDGSTGLLAKPRDAFDFADKISLLADSRSTRDQIVRQAFAFAQSQSWERIFDRQLESYERVIDEFALQQLCKEREAA